MVRVHRACDRENRQSKDDSKSFHAPSSLPIATAIVREWRIFVAGVLRMLMSVAALRA
jgi:hypothetical protein